MRLRFMVRLSATSPTGRHAQSFGFRVGYWPCLRAPFVSLAFAKWHFDLWYGLPSPKSGLTSDCK